MTAAAAWPRERVLLLGLFAAGFALRWLFADGDFIGDDAWYLYLARSFGREPLVAAEHPLFHLANRPLFYLFYHPSTYAGLVGFRLLGCCVGAAVPVLAFRAARSFGASLPSAALTAGLLCVHRQQLVYSAAVFPDVLAAAFALAACWAVARERDGWVLLFASASVASKESFVLVPVICVVIGALGRMQRGLPLRLNRTQWLTLIAPTAYVGLVTAITLASPGLRMQGWATTPFTLKHARNMWVGPELWPLLAWLCVRRKARILVLWLALPAFYLLWSRVLGRGLAPWYVVGPSALSSVAAALALDFVAARAALVGRGPLRRRAAIGLCVLCYAPIAWFGLLRARAQWIGLGDHFPWPSAAPEVRALLARRRPSSLLLVDCFWAYRYSHLRGPEPAKAVWWFGPQDTEHVLQAAAAAPLLVICRMPGHAAIAAALSAAPARVLLENSGYLVVSHPR